MSKTPYLANLIVLEHKDFDVILWIDWLTSHKALIDCGQKRIVLPLKEVGMVVLRGREPLLEELKISDSKADRLLTRGECGIVVSALLERDQARIVDGIPIVNEFPQVFPKERPGLPSSREIEFEIHLE